MDRFSILPPKLILHIGSFLKIPELTSLSGVSRIFRQIVQKSDELWSGAITEFGLECDPDIEKKITEGNC
jgi:hypothetical protein